MRRALAAIASVAALLACSPATPAFAGAGAAPTYASKSACKAAGKGYCSYRIIHGRHVWSWDRATINALKAAGSPRKAARVVKPKPSTTDGKGVMQATVRSPRTGRDKAFSSATIRRVLIHDPPTPIAASPAPRGRGRWWHLTLDNRGCPWYNVIIEQ